MRKLITDNKLKRCGIFFTAVDKDGKKLYDFFFNDRMSLYLLKVDLTNRKYLRPSDPEYPQSTLPTINDLIRSKKVEGEFAPYRQYEISPKEFQEYTYEIKTTSTKTLVKKLDVDRITSEFREHGFSVSREAVIHNFYAWLADMKSGYRGKGYHLFTPCGCNPLRFSASELYPACEDWQHTYEC